MMSWTYLGGTSEGTTRSTYAMVVNVMGSANVSKNKIDQAYSGVLDFVQACYTRSQNDGDSLKEIKGYKVEKYTTDLDFKYSGTCDVKKQQSDLATQWLNNNNWNDPDHHVWITACDKISWADPTGAWEGKRTNSVVATAQYPNSSIAPIAAHETMHTHVDHSVSSVKDDLGPNDDEHSLGTEYSDDFSSPACATYPAKAEVGSCRTNNSDDDYWTTTATDCTTSAVISTLEDRLGK